MQRRRNGKKAMLWMEGWRKSKVERESVWKHCDDLSVHGRVKRQERCVSERSGPHLSLSNLLTLVIIHMSGLNDELLPC